MFHDQFLPLTRFVAFSLGLLPTIGAQGFVNLDFEDSRSFQAEKLTEQSVNNAPSLSKDDPESRPCLARHRLENKPITADSYPNLEAATYGNPIQTGP